MIASRLGLAVLAAIAVALALLVVLDHALPALDHALAPGFDPERVTRLAWQRPGQPDVVVEHATDWHFAHEPGRPAAVTGDVGIADPAGIVNLRRVGEVLAALRSARWHRRAAVEQAGAIVTTLVTPQASIGIAGTLGDQQWLVVGDRALLVDAWVARALDPAPLELRDTAPFANVAQARLIGVGDFVLEGSPRRLVRAHGVTLWPAPQLVAKLEAALAALVVVALPTGPITRDQPKMIVVNQTVRLVGNACPGGGVWIEGAGCATSAAWQAVRAAVAALEGDPLAIADPRPLPVTPARLVLPDGSALALDSRPQLELGAAHFDIDAVAVSELLAALAAPAEIVAPPKGTPQHALTADAIALDLYAPDIIVRRGEPVGLRVGAGIWQLLLRPGVAYRTRVLWREEPTTITTVTIDGIAWQRGAVIGEWQRATPPVAAKLEALVSQLAAPEAIADSPHFAIAHRVTLTVTAPGTPATHTLELGAPTAAGCPVRTDRDLMLPAAACTMP